MIEQIDFIVKHNAIALNLRMLNYYRLYAEPHVTRCNSIAHIAFKFKYIFEIIVVERRIVSFNERKLIFFSRCTSFHLGVPEKRTRLFMDSVARKCDVFTNKTPEIGM